MGKNINISINTGLKYCPRCQQYKPITDFYSNGKRGVGCYCKECENAYQKNRLQNKKAEFEAMKQTVLLYEKQNKSKSELNIANMDDSALLKELKNRGYVGTLKYNKTVNL